MTPSHDGTTRRSFLLRALSGVGSLALATPAWAGEDRGARIALALAEWSLHRALHSGKLDHLEFPAKASKELGISAVEYVNGFFGGKKMEFREAGTSRTYLAELLKRSEDAGVTNHLIMVDDEGSLAASDEEERLAAVDAHKKWIEAAKILGCRSVRVNLHGSGSPQERTAASVDSLGRLAELAAPLGVDVLVENHGGVTSNGAWLADVMKRVSPRAANIGTLPDFGNFCVSDPWGSTQSGCEDPYDRYKGVEELLPYAKGVSAKTYDFDDRGGQPLMDYERLIGLVKRSGFQGYIGIEYEGDAVPEEDGVRKTKALLERYL